MKEEKKEKKCVVQCRVSSLRQSQEGDSLEAQERTIRSFIDGRGWKIVPDEKVWSTAISGRKTDREDFEDILSFIKSHPGVVDYYVFKSIDRATRAGGEEYARMKRELFAYGVEMVDTYGVIQPSINTLKEYGIAYDWSKFSPSEINEGVLATVAKQEVTSILTRMIGAEIRLTQSGFRTRRATDGYKNEKIFVEGKKRVIQTPNPDRAKYYVAMFELRAQGLTDPEIVKRVNGIGYRSEFHNRYDKRKTRIIGRTGGLPLTVKQLQRNIKNPIYAGVLCEKWTHYKPIKAQYDGLVSIETFNRANRGELAIMKNQDGSLELVQGRPFGVSGKERNRNNPLFPYKFLLCSVCGKHFSGSCPRSKSGKRHPTYHCSRKHKYLGVNKKDFEDVIEKYIKNLKFSPGLANALELTFLNKYRSREKEIVKASDNIHQNIAELELQQAKKLEAFESTKSDLIREKLEKDIEDLEVKIKEAGNERLKIQISRDDIKAFMQDAKKIMEHPSEILLNSKDLRVQRELFGLVFEKMPSYQEIVSGTPKLSCAFKLSSEFAQSKSQLVTLVGQNWNQLIIELNTWFVLGREVDRVQYSA